MAAAKRLDQDPLRRTCGGVTALANESGEGGPTRKKLQELLWRFAHTKTGQLWKKRFDERD